MTTATTTIETLLTAISAIVTQSLEWVVEFATVIGEQPLLLMFVVVSFVGLGAGLIKRIIRL